jgi:hypothetical protein
MNEPKYTDAQIESHIGMLDANQQIGAIGMIRTARDMLRSLLSERQAAMQGQGGDRNDNADVPDGEIWLYDKSKLLTPPTKDTPNAHE